MKKFFAVFIFFILTAATVLAQFGDSQWKNYRHELFFGAGPSNFMGDFGGTNEIGSYSLKDLDIKASRFALQGGYSYKLAERWGFGASLSYIQVYGADRFAKDPNRKARDMHFKSSIFELSATISFSLSVEDYSQKYNVGARGKSSKTPNWYIYTGISGLYFNPKAQHSNGKWYNLQPLGTEGQGIISTRDEYSSIAIAIPVGMGLIFPINSNWGIGFELGFRYTFTDYLDDVSSTYIDPLLFNDPIARYFHNPTAYVDGESAWEGSGIGKQRGNNKIHDTYMFVLIKTTYKIPSRRFYMPKF